MFLDKTGVIPKYSICDTGVDWFKERNQWLESSEEPQAGMIIFLIGNLTDLTAIPTTQE